MHDSQPVLPNVSKQDAGKEIGQSSNFIHFNFIIIFERFAHCRRIDIERHFPEMKILKNNSCQLQIKGVKKNRRRKTNVKKQNTRPNLRGFGYGLIEIREDFFCKTSQSRPIGRGCVTLAVGPFPEPR